jgi:ATP-dependent exoDNAse (exonuclease V) beta subunit
MDRVVLDPDRVQVIDFKTGERQDYTSQMRVYMEILRRVYPNRNTEGYLAYVDSGWVEGVN